MTARGVAGPIVALTGTPGTGKTSVALRLSELGEAVLDLGRYSGDERFDCGEDPLRPGTRVLDEEKLSDFLSESLVEELGLAVPYAGPVFVDSHFSHQLLCVDRVIVLRLAPSVLRERLERRGWTEEKVRENIEAEALDVILAEALDERDATAEEGEVFPVGEVDCTGLSVEEMVERVRALAVAPPANLEIGTVDWSDEVLGWY